MEDIIMHMQLWHIGGLQAITEIRQTSIRIRAWVYTITSAWNWDEITHLRFNFKGDADKAQLKLGYGWVIIPCSCAVAHAPFAFNPCWCYRPFNLWGEFIGHQWIPPHPTPTKACDAGFWCFFFISAWMNGRVNNRDAGRLRRRIAHYNVIVMSLRTPRASLFDIDKTVHHNFICFFFISLGYGRNLFSLKDIGSMMIHTGNLRERNMIFCHC